MAATTKPRKKKPIVKKTSASIASRTALGKPFYVCKQHDFATNPTKPKESQELGRDLHLRLVHGPNALKKTGRGKKKTKVAGAHAKTVTIASDTVPVITTRKNNSGDAVSTLMTKLRTRLINKADNSTPAIAATIMDCVTEMTLVFAGRKV